MSMRNLKQQQQRATHEKITANSTTSSAKPIPHDAKKRSKMSLDEYSFLPRKKHIPPESSQCRARFCLAPAPGACVPLRCLPVHRHQPPNDGHEERHSQNQHHNTTGTARTSIHPKPGYMSARTGPLKMEGRGGKRARTQALLCCPDCQTTRGGVDSVQSNARESE